MVDLVHQCDDLWIDLGDMYFTTLVGNWFKSRVAAGYLSWGVIPDIGIVFYVGA